MSVNKFGQYVGVNHHHPSTQRQRQYPDIIEVTPAGEVSFGNLKLYSSIAPTNGKDIVNKQYVDGEISRSSKRYADNVLVEMEKRREKDNSNTTEKLTKLYEHLMNVMAEVERKIDYGPTAEKVRKLDDKFNIEFPQLKEHLEAVKGDTKELFLSQKDCEASCYKQNKSIADKLKKLQDNFNLELPQLNEQMDAVKSDIKKLFLS